MMKFISLFFITAGWIVSLIPLILLTLSNLTDDNIGLALCFLAIIIFISGQFFDILLKELNNKDIKDKPYTRHPMDTSGINPNVTSFNDKDVPGRY